jgi:hypothetical protein
MTTMQDRLIESMIKDFNSINEFEDGKSLRKDCSLLIKRIESAKQLLSDNAILVSQLKDLELKVQNLKLKV